jgi:hypothetical protein
MSYNIARQVSPQVAILSFSSAGAGNVVFASVNGQFSITGTGTSTLQLEAGYEYFLTSSPVTSSATAATFYHIVDGVNGTSYSIVSTSFTSGLDQQIESIQSDATSTFYLRFGGCHYDS